jgi:hypothetical protein
MLMRRLSALALLLAAFSAHAQVGLDLSLGPTVNWVQDFSTLTVDPDNPGTVVDRDSVMLPVLVGVQGGLGLTVRSGPVGVRFGGRFLNTSALYDGQQTLNRDALQTSFVTASLDLQLTQRLAPGVQAWVFAGPEGRYLLDLSGDVDSVADVRDGLDLLSVTANVGAGLSFGVGGLRVGPEARYAFDLTGIDGGDVTLDNGNVVRLDEAFRVNSLLLGLVFRGR